MTRDPHRGSSYRVLRQRNFAIFWSAALVSNSGSWMQATAVPFVVFRITHSATWLGIAATAQFLPAILVGPIAGSLADRVSRRRILVGTQVAMMLLSLALWVLWVSGAARPGLIVAIVFLYGCVMGTDLTTWQAFVPQLVEPEDVMDAVRLNAMQSMGARAFGPALAGLALELVGPAGAFLGNAVTYLLVLLGLALVHPRAQPLSEHTGSHAGHYVDGLKVVVRTRPLLLPVLTMGFVTLLGTAWVQLSPALATDVYDVGRGAYGMLVASFGIGTVLGSVLNAGIADRVRNSRMAVIGWLGMGVGLLVMGAAPTYLLGALGFGVVGFAYTQVATAANAGIQGAVAEEYRGRTASVYLTVLMVSVPLGVLVMGNLASLVTLRGMLVGSGIGLAALLGLVALRFDRMAPLDAPRDVAEPLGAGGAA